MFPDLKLRGILLDFGTVCVNLKCYQSELNLECYPVSKWSHHLLDMNLLAIHMNSTKVHVIISV